MLLIRLMRFLVAGLLLARFRREVPVRLIRLKGDGGVAVKP